MIVRGDFSGKMSRKLFPHSHGSSEKASNARPRISLLYSLSPVPSDMEMLVVAGSEVPAYREAKQSIYRRALAERSI